MKIEAQLLLESACWLQHILWHHLEEVHPGIFSCWDKIHLDPSPSGTARGSLIDLSGLRLPQPPFNETVIAHGRPALQRRMWRRGERQRAEMWTEYVTQCTINPTHTHRWRVRGGKWARWPERRQKERECVWIIRETIWQKKIKVREPLRTVRSYWSD